ncbi:MAG: hypothetical protein WCK13_07945 [Ignavibacteriota bacterium]|nr:hypothetical protein [Ignavibacteriota bacterium]
MAKVVKSKKAKAAEILHLSLTNKNYMIIGLGIILIIIGYVFMAENSVDGFLPTVVAPILLVIGYIVVVPFGILYKDKSANGDITEAHETVSVGTKNIKTQ